MNDTGSITETLPIEKLREFFVGNGRLIKSIEREFDLRIETDGSALVLTGNPGGLTKAKHVLSALDAYASQEEDIDLNTVRYFCRLAEENHLDDFLENASGPVLMTPRGKAIRAKTLGQQVYIDAQRRNDVVLCIGPAGTGKTFLGVAMAVAAFKNREVSRIILARPAVEAGERLGFLPGDVQEKVDPYMRPIYDALFELLGEEAFVRYSEKGLIEVSPLAFMRGRTLDDAFIVLDEAQNTTVEQMKMFLTRIGMNARACVLGDITQVDLPRGVTSGLTDACEVLSDVEGLSVVTLSDADIVRNPLVQRILRAYNSRVERRTVE